MSLIKLRDSYVELRRRQRVTADRGKSITASDAARTRPYEMVSGSRAEGIDAVAFRAANSESGVMGTPTLGIAVGESRRASPLSSPTIVRKVSVDGSGNLSEEDTLAPARYLLSVSNHAGERKRWTMVTLYKSMRVG
jgi:hypothetical protein